MSADECRFTVSNNSVHTLQEKGETEVPHSNIIEIMDRFVGCGNVIWGTVMLGCSADLEEDSATGVSY